MNESQGAQHGQGTSGGRDTIDGTVEGICGFPEAGLTRHARVPSGYPPLGGNAERAGNSAQAAGARLCPPTRSDPRATDPTVATRSGTGVLYRDRLRILLTQVRDWRIG